VKKIEEIGDFLSIYPYKIEMMVAEEDEEQVVEQGTSEN
jgi:hypothetical protein